MSQLTGKTKQPCWAEFKCHYRVGNNCSFWQQLEVMLSVLQEKYHKGANCIVNLADTYSLPCIGLDEERRWRGIEDVFGLSE